MSRQYGLKLAGLLAIGLWGCAALAHEAGQEQVTPLQAKALSDVPGKRGLLAVVSFAPGQASTPHRHDGSLFAYVLEGEVLSQMTGEAPVTYKAGDSWYETPRQAHLVARNASDSKPARLLVWALVGEGKPIREPLPAQ
ncbi:cupin domain-containing protein [Chitinimonas naiadis]